MSMAASAQWQWTDKEGRKVYSDRAPPADVLEKNILKRPEARSTTAGRADAVTPAAVSDPAVTAPPQGTASSPRLSGVDKELLEKKKKAEEAEVAKRKTAEENRLKAKVENCARAKQSKATLDSSMRIARINEKGEREVLGAAERAAEAKRVQSIIDADCQ